MKTEDAGAGRQFSLIAGTVIAGFCVFLQLYSPQPLLVLFRGFFGETEGRVSLVVSAASFAVAVFSPLVGFLADGIGRKRIVFPSLFILSAATICCGFARTLDQLVLFRFVAGACTPGVIAVIIAYISEEAKPGTSGGVMALYVTGTVIGGLTGRLSAAFMADNFSWRYSFYLLGVMTAAGGILTWVFLPASKNFVKQKDRMSVVRSMRGHLRNGKLIATYATGFNALFCHVGLFTYANFHLAKPPFSLSTSALGLVFLVYALGIVITPMAGMIIDRFGYRAGGMLAISFITTGLLMTLTDNLSVFIAGLAVASTGIFIIQSTASSHAGHAAEGARSAATGLYVAFYYLGGSAGATALVVPWTYGGWRALIASMIIVQLVSLILVRRYFDVSCKREELTSEAPGC